jgi:hypothetical protein
MTPPKRQGSVMDDIAEIWNRYDILVTLGGAILALVGAKLFTTEERARVAWALLLTGVAMLVCVPVIDRFQTAQKTFDVAFPPEVAEAEPEHHGDRPEKAIQDEGLKGSNVSPDETEEFAGVTAAQLNRSRLAGQWTRSPDGSFQWISHAVILEQKVPGGKLVNASDSRWEFEPEIVQHEDGSYSPVPPLPN